MTGDKHAKVVLGDGAAGDVSALNATEATTPAPAPAPVPAPAPAPAPVVARPRPTAEERQGAK